jgi:predicted GTPase
MCHNDKNNNLYPEGVMIYPEEQLEELIERFHATTCAMAYSDVNYTTLQSLAARANAAGCKFVQLSPKTTMLPSTKPVIAVCASRTGTGKSQTTRYICEYLKSKGKTVAVVRHPMPYDKALLRQRCQRYEKLEDMDKYDCTIEEREEYQRHIEAGNLLFAGVDYEMILREAEKDADVVVWDGGNNDASFFRPDLLITVVDALRPTHEEQFYPGEVNVRMADVVLINKVNALHDPEAVVEQVRHLKDTIVRKESPILLGNSVVTPEATNETTGELLSEVEAIAMIKGKRVLVIDDGPTLTHGGMAFGAGYSLAKKLQAGTIVDPRPFAVGDLIHTFEKFVHLKEVLPAMGYGEKMVKDLEATVNKVDCDTVVVGTPIDLRLVLKMNKPTVQARYSLELVSGNAFQFHQAIDSVFERFAHGSH